MKIEVITFAHCKNIDKDRDTIIITVSKANNWMRGLSPFILGPCPLYGDFISKNMENAWQFSKVYPEFIDGEKIKDEYFEWARKGWEDSTAHRYPMGKGKIPNFSYWDGQKLGYVAARKKIYIPLYANAVKDTEAFKYLKATYETCIKDNRDLYLVDFDAYRHKQMGMTYTDVANCSTKKMGHAFVLAMMLEAQQELWDITYE